MSSRYCHATNEYVYHLLKPCSGGLSTIEWDGYGNGGPRVATSRRVNTAPRLDRAFRSNFLLLFRVRLGRNREEGMGVRRRGLLGCSLVEEGKS